MQRSALCRSRRELSNEYLLAKIGVDTAENEPCKVCPLSAYRSPRCYVDVENCEGLAKTGSTASMFFPGQPLHYNYATCRIPDNVVRVKWDKLCVGWTVQLKPEANPCDDYTNPGAHVCDGMGDGPCHCDPCAACSAGSRRLELADASAPCSDDHAAAAAVLGITICKRRGVSFFDRYFRKFVAIFCDIFSRILSYSLQNVICNISLKIVVKL